MTEYDLLADMFDALDHAEGDAYGCPAADYAPDMDDYEWMQLIALGA